jgi:hypothetical protein
VAAAGLVLLRPRLAVDELEALRRRVPFGASESEVAVGRPADKTTRLRMPDGSWREGVKCWDYANGSLLVSFREDGRSFLAEVYRDEDPTLWERFRAWLGL